MPAILSTPKTLQTWGCPQTFSHLSGPELQAKLDMWAFANYFRGATGVPRRYTLFQRIADFLVPDWFEWHDWTEAIIDAACRRRWMAVAGCANCISGDTRILDAITGDQIPVRELCEKGIAPTVMTLHGPAQASVPFVKGSAELFEVTLENGNRFAATAEHVVLSANGFSFVKSLALGQRIFAYDPILPSSTSELGLSNQQPDASRYLKTVEGSQSDCRPLFHSCDEQLRLARDAARSSFPPQVDAPEHILPHFCSGDPRIVYKYNLSSFLSDHPSTLDDCRRHSLLDIPASPPPGLRTASRAGHSFQPFSQYVSASSFQEPFSEPVPDFLNMLLEHTPSANRSLLVSEIFSTGGAQSEQLRRFPSGLSDFSASPKSDPYTGYTDSVASSIGSIHDLCALSLKVAQAKIVSIKKVGFDTFYDLSVPGVEHYFAEGAIHHNSAKTRNVAGYGCVYWLCAPEQTSFIMCSTTMKMLRKRGWSEIHNFYDAFTARWGEFGNMVDSRTMWQHQAGDDKHAIFGLAVQEGDTNKAAGNIQGLHTKRCLVGLDEAEEIPPAIWKAGANLYSYPIDVGGEFTLIAVANPRSRLSRFGRYIEPLGGWDSVSVETEEWESKPQLDGKKALVVRLDFLKSPNCKADRTVSKHLPTKLRVKNRMDALKARGAENDPDHYCYDRGFPVPEGLIKAVFTESLFTMHRGYDLHQFNGENFTIIAFFDQAFGGGDRPALRFAALGNISPTKMGIEWMPPIEIPIDSEKIATRPVRYQLFDCIKKHCEGVSYRGQLHQCLKQNLGIDVTGEGGLADICDQEWTGPPVVRVQFGGSPSEDPCSHEDPRPAKEVYRNKRAEMYFRTKNALGAGQLRGVDKDTASELCTIEYYESNDKGMRVPITIQSKKDYKIKYTKSPDYADCGIGITEVARLRGFRIVETGHTVTRGVEVDRMVENAHAVYQEIDYAPQEEEDDEAEYANEEI